MGPSPPKASTLSAPSSTTSTPTSSTQKKVQEEYDNHKPEHLVPIFDRVVSGAKERTKDPKYPTGIGKLDEVIWGFHIGQVCTVAARPSDGKTTFLLQTAWNLANRKIPVLVISLEMSKEELVERLFCHEMKIDNQILRRGTWESVSKQMETFVKKLHEIPLYLIDAKGHTMEQVEKIIEASPSVKAVFLDYLQLIKSGENAKRNYEIGQYLRDFRILSKKKKFCLITLAQIHRASQERPDKRPRLHDLKDSGDIEQDSDTVIILYWTCNNEKQADINKYEIMIMKQRHGPLKHIDIRFKPEIYTFSDY